VQKLKTIYNIRPTHNQQKAKMKSYDELKAKMEAIQQQMVQAKKNELANALQKVKRLLKSSVLLLEC